MASVFISYAREDAAKARSIAKALEQAALQVWFDERIHSGSEFSREIEEALAGAAAIVVLWSTNSIESGWVRDEAAEGRDSGRLVPLVLDECRPPIGFRQIQATDLSRWSGRGRPKQIDDVIAAVRAKAGEPPRTKAGPATPSRRRLIGWAAGALAAVAVAIAGLVLPGRMGNQAAAAPRVAVLPFAADAADTDARRLASAAHDAVAHTLSLGAFAVTTSDAATQGGPKSDFLISGQVSRAGEKFVATIRMQETAHQVVVFSQQFEESRDKAGDLPERIGAQVAAQLSWTAPLIAMERRHPSDPAIVASLLQSSAAGGPDAVGTLQDYEKTRRLAAQAPGSPLAQNNFAFSTAFALAQLPREQRAEVVAEARRAADRSVALAPEFGDNYIPWCLLRSEQRRIQCEDRLRAAMRADADAPFVNWFLASLILSQVGRNQEAVELASLSLAHDQYMPYKIGLMLRTLEVADRSDEADELYKRAIRWWPDLRMIGFYRFAGMVARGDFEAAQRFDIEAGDRDRPRPVLSAISRKSLAAAQGACADSEFFEGTICMLALARLGDLDGSFKLADRLYPSRRGRTPAEEDRIWLDNPVAAPVLFLTAPAAAPLRRDPRYVALAQRVGLLEYWRSGRPPDFCRTSPEPICPKLLANK